VGAEAEAEAVAAPAPGASDPAASAAGGVASSDPDPAFRSVPGTGSTVGKTGGDEGEPTGVCTMGVGGERFAGN